MRTKPVLTFSKLEPETRDLLDRMFGAKYSRIEINPGRVFLPELYKSFGQGILDLDVMESDVWMCSYPRTGSPWAQEMVWLIGHDLDYEGAKSLQQIRCPFVELSCVMEANHSAWFKEFKSGSSLDVVKYHLPHPRYIRSHLPWDLLPVDIERDDGSVKPKASMVVSYYHYCTLVHRLKGTFEEFCDLFMKGRAPYGPVWNHILAFWRRRHDPNVLFIKFEEMKSDLPSVVRRTAAFLNKDITDTQVDKLCSYLSFEHMKTNRAVNLEATLEKTFGTNYLESTNLRFIRKGEIGDWKNHMSDDLSQRFDEWIAEHFKGTELSFE